MPQIRQLPPDVVNKIAAGEVIERPASVVKELMENAVDAGATRIEVSLEQGGMQLVRVADDGVGIPEQQLPLAVASHATSKIEDADDLFRVGTLGFRGEALASIAAISRLRIRGRAADADAGAELEVTGGRMADVVPCGCPRGTTIEVHDLFYNTPVRRKFMRTTQTEVGHACEAFTRIALAFPAVHMTMRHNGRTLHDLPPCERWRDRVAALFGDQLAEGLIWVESDDTQARISGYVADPQFSRAANRMQYLFLNGRHIRDRSLQHALGEAYRGLLLTGRHPIVFLRLDLPPDAVDVNVHPTKLEVRFVDSGRLYSQLLGTIRGKFLATDLTARVHASTAGNAASGATATDGTAAESERTGAAAGFQTSSTGAGSAGAAPANDGLAGEAHDAGQAQRHRQELVQWAQGQLPAVVAEPVSGSYPTTAWPADRGGRTPAPLPGSAPSGDATHGATESWRASDGPGLAARGADDPTHLPNDSHPGPHRNPLTGPVAARGPVAAVGGQRGLQLQNRYLITENDEGIVVIDQHALHERVLYEQLREKVLSEGMETQQLLVPEPVHLAPAEAAAALDAREELAQLGIRIEPFGGDTVLVSSYPAMLRNVSPGELLRQVVDQMMAGGQTPQRRDLLDELLHMISCKAAVKAGDRLSADEVTALLEQRHLCQDAHHCPHGRPTALVFTREELDRRFRRT
jgi:DNA mismatch repair protein MutL